VTVAIAAIAVSAVLALLLALLAPSARDPRRFFRRVPEICDTPVPGLVTPVITWPALLGLEALDEAERFQVVLTLRTVDLPSVPIAIRQALEEEVDPQFRDLLVEAARRYPGLREGAAIV
jgi:hypothetical protein